MGNQVPVSFVGARNSGPFVGGRKYSYQQMMVAVGAAVLLTPLETLFVFGFSLLMGLWRLSIVRTPYGLQHRLKQWLVMLKWYFPMVTFCSLAQLQKFYIMNLCKDTIAMCHQKRKQMKFFNSGFICPRMVNLRSMLVRCG